MEDEKEEHKEDENKDKRIPPEGTKNILLEKFKLAAEIQDRYNNLFWQRTGVFFAIVSALFVGYGLIGSEILKQFITNDGSLPQGAIPFTLILIIFGGVGAYVSWLWRQIHRRATFLQNYYRFRASVLEKEIGDEPEIFAKGYMIASTERYSKKEGPEKSWRDVYGNEWENKKNEWDTQFRGLANKKGWDEAKGRDPGSLRERLDQVYLIFMGVWIAMSVLGCVMLLAALKILKLSWGT
jgi:hypothetical protein